MITLTIVTLVCIIGILFAIIGSAFIRENEIGIRSTLGILGSGLGPGLHWGFFPITRIIVFETKMQSIRFNVEEIPTKKGRVKGSVETVETNSITAQCMVNYFFCKEKLALTVKNAPGKSERKMAEVLVPFTQDILRNMISKMPWVLANEERFKLTVVALSRMIPIDPRNRRCFYLNKSEPEECDQKSKGKTVTYSFEDFDPDNEATKKYLPPTLEQLRLNSPFVQFGLDNVSLVMEKIIFPNKEMQEALSKPEVARLEKHATELKADAEKYKRKREGEGSAHAREMMINVIKENPDLEMLLTLRDMAQGTSNTILYQIPYAFEQRMAKILGGNSIENVMGRLKPEHQKLILDQINDALKNMAKKSGGK